MLTPQLLRGTAPPAKTAKRSSAPPRRMLNAVQSAHSVWACPARTAAPMIAILGCRPPLRKRWFAANSWSPSPEYAGRATRRSTNSEFGPSTKNLPGPSRWILVAEPAASARCQRLTNLMQRHWPPWRLGEDLLGLQVQEAQAHGRWPMMLSRWPTPPQPQYAPWGRARPPVAGFPDAVGMRVAAEADAVAQVPDAHSFFQRARGWRRVRPPWHRSGCRHGPELR